MRYDKKFNLFFNISLNNDFANSSKLAIHD